MNLERYFIEADQSINDAIMRLNHAATQILLVVDKNQILLGTVTDGDVRRAILSGKALADMRLANFMQKNPTVAETDWSPQHAQSVMHSKRIHHIPIVDKKGRVTGIFTKESLVSQTHLPNTAFIMAGGLGSRLGKMTENCPKPMLQIGGKPILETIIETLRDAGLRRVVLAVNYLANQIMEYFGDGRNHEIEIGYVIETERLGTVGALRLLTPAPTHPVLVMNGDILTQVNYGHLLRYHEEHDAAATMCVREFNHRIPFGVVELEGNRIRTITEKPETTYFVNSGIYVLSPSAIDYIPNSGAFDMPSLFAQLNTDLLPTVAYPIQEYWADIGHPGDFQQAESEYTANFQNKAAIFEQ
jgi:dTDP-glucose pyrophosphorylase